jgi:hypothetical protein
MAELPSGTFLRFADAGAEIMRTPVAAAASVNPNRLGLINRSYV